MIGGYGAVNIPTKENATFSIISLDLGERVTI